MSNPAPSEPQSEAPVVTANLGRSVFVKGELTGSQDLTVDGRVEGLIDLRDHELTIGPNAAVHAEIIAKTITVFGSVVGNVTARETLHLRHGGSLEGDVVCASITIQDRAHFCGSVDMGKRSQKTAGAAADGAAAAVA
jgi:cytoskeletal protein CcmA (bactofilin family)